MDTNLLAALIGVVAGALGYWIATFWMHPIVQYRDLRMKVHGDFIFYAQVINADGLSDQMKSMYQERISANRRSAADLAACLAELPLWYKKWLGRRGLDPDAAARHLIGYSNTTDYEGAAKLAAAIQRELGIERDVE